MTLQLDPRSADLNSTIIDGPFGNLLTGHP